MNETTGRREELLPQLAHNYPFVFRDRELVYARVVPGDDYRIESYSSDPSQWIAFGEPLESGRLTPLIVAVGQSGKLFSLGGMGLLALVLSFRLVQAVRNSHRPRTPCRYPTSHAATRPSLGTPDNGHAVRELNAVSYLGVGKLLREERRSAVLDPAPAAAARHVEP